MTVMLNTISITNERGAQAMIYNVGIYLRLSRDDGKSGESESIASQRAIINNYCAQHSDFVIYKEYIDDGFSGTNFERPAFCELLNDIEQKKVNCVITKDQSRLGRQNWKTGYYMEEYFPENKVRYIAVNNNYDSIKLNSGMVPQFTNMVNDAYSRDLSCKVQSAIKIKAQGGMFVGSHACYGYQKSSADKHKLVIDEYAAEIVKKIFNLYLQGYGKQSIAKILNKDNILCPTEYKKRNGENYRNPNKLKTTTYWTASSINAVLRQENYTGTLVQGKKNTSKYTFERRINKADWIRVPNTHEAIIDRETFDKAQELLSLRTRQNDMQNAVGLFAGLIKCGDCGRALIRSKECTKYKNNKYYYISYRCRTYKQYSKEACTSHRIGEKVLISTILNDMNELIYKLNNIDKIIEKVAESDNKVKEKQKSINDIKYELSRLSAKKSRAYNDYNEDLLTRDEYIKFKNDINNKEDTLNKKLACLSVEPEDRLHTLLSNPVIKKLYNRTALTENDLTREMIVELVQSITVFEDKQNATKHIEIVYTFSNEIELLK
jgi:DNA invertase Pin-like site-specific DNA recombinase